MAGKEVVERSVGSLWYEMITAANQFWRHQIVRPVEVGSDAMAAAIGQQEAKEITLQRIVDALVKGDVVVFQDEQEKVVSGIRARKKVTADDTAEITAIEICRMHRIGNAIHFVLEEPRINLSLGKISRGVTFTVKGVAEGIEHAISMFSGSTIPSGNFTIAIRDPKQPEPKGADIILQRNNQGKLHILAPDVQQQSE